MPRNYDVGPDTPPDDVVEILEEACQALNHEDTEFIPAIQWAIAFIREDRRPYEDQ